MKLPFCRSLFSTRMMPLNRMELKWCKLWFILRNWIFWILKQVMWAAIVWKVNRTFLFLKVMKNKVVFYKGSGRWQLHICSILGKRALGTFWDSTHEYHSCIWLGWESGTKIETDYSIGQMWIDPIRNRLYVTNPQIDDVLYLDLDDFLVPNTGLWIHQLNNRIASDVKFNPKTWIF